MQKNNLHILSTRPLTPALIAEAAEAGIAIDEVSFIQTTPLTDAVTVQKIKEAGQKKLTVIFTSMNAVEAVAAQLDTKPHWKIYCIGNTTRQLAAEKLACAIKGTAAYAAELADVIINDGVQEATFFCGNIRRDVLPDKLRTAGIALEEIVVYTTTETATTIMKTYDGILFYSPSAVHSYFSANKPFLKTLFFAIGTTTAEAIQQYTSNTVIVADATGKVELVQHAIRYFSKQKNEL